MRLTPRHLKNRLKTVPREALNPSWFVQRLVFHHLFEYQHPKLQAWRGLTYPKRAEKLRSTKAPLPEQRLLLKDVTSDFFADRIGNFRHLARVEGELGHDLVQALYLMRTMRWLGTDRFTERSLVQDIFRKHGFFEEAKVLDLIFSPDTTDAAIESYLEAQCEKHRTLPDFQYERLENRRTSATAKVSIIVSLYNAADKLPLFLREIRKQTYRSFEIVLIDSGSALDEYTPYLEFAAANPEVSLVYARSRERETIQSAWNRGLHLAQGDYVCFLGVDEMLASDGLETLVTELDQDPKLDWIGSNAELWDVDPSGKKLRKIYDIDRASEFTSDVNFVDPGFLTFVGYLHRRSVHQRFGYFDPSFRAAGDTEFKNRILRNLQTKILPQTIGYFLNYPEDRMTDHPRSEIEDLRALYLYRTLGGIRYSFKNRSTDEILKILRLSLGFRRTNSYKTFMNLEYALNICRYLQSRDDFHPVDTLAERLNEILIGCRRLDNSGKDIFPLVHKLDQDLARLLERESAVFERPRQPRAQLFSDTRYFQNVMTW